MGNSYTGFKNQGFSAKDGQICVWLYLLVEEIDKLENPDAWLLEARKEWHIQSTLGINGCVSPGLDEILTNQEKVNTIIKLSEAALKKLSESSPRITLKTDYSYGADGPDTICNGVDVRIHEIYGKEFIKLLKGEPVSTEAAWPTKFYPDKGSPNNGN